MDYQDKHPMMKMFLVIVAHAAHLHGRKHVDYIVEEKEGVHILTVTKNRKALYQGKGSCQHKALHAIFKDLCKKESKVLDQHSEDGCYICGLFADVWQYESMRLMVTSLAKGAIETMEKMARGEPPTAGKSEKPEYLN